jgi:hypothetical protein
MEGISQRSKPNRGYKAGEVSWVLNPRQSPLQPVDYRDKSFSVGPLCHMCADMLVPKEHMARDLITCK